MAVLAGDAELARGYTRFALQSGLLWSYASWPQEAKTLHFTFRKDSLSIAYTWTHNKLWVQGIIIVCFSVLFSFRLGALFYVFHSAFTGWTSSAILFVEQYFSSHVLRRPYPSSLLCDSLFTVWLVSNQSLCEFIKILVDLTFSSCNDLWLRAHMVRCCSVHGEWCGVTEKREKEW